MRWWVTTACLAITCSCDSLVTPQSANSADCVATSFVAVSQSGFTPPCATLAQGGELTVTNSDTVSHTIIGDSNNIMLFNLGAVAAGASATSPALLGALPVRVYCTDAPNLSLNVELVAAAIDPNQVGDSNQTLNPNQ